MRGVQVPERTEDFTADPVELFFDLGFVFAFSQLVSHLIHHHTWSGVGEAALLFIMMWMNWSQFTWSANAVSGNGRVVRLLFLLGTIVAIPMAASVTTAFGSGGPTFAFSMVAIYAIGIVTMLIGLDRASAVWKSTIELAAVAAIGNGLLIVGSFLDGTARVIAWLGVLACYVFALVRAGRREWIVRAGHFAERHGLIVIIALGEVIVAIGIAVVASLDDGEGLGGSTTAALVAASALAAMLWWAYFDRVQPALEHRNEQFDGDIAQGRFTRDAYTGAHALIVGGIILLAAAVEEIALHPDVPADLSYRLMFAGGFALVMVGIAFAVWRAWRAIALERIVLTVVTAVALLAFGSWAGVWLLILVDVILLLALLGEHSRIEKHHHPIIIGSQS